MEAKQTPVGSILHFVDRVVYQIEEKAIALSVILLAVILIGNVTLRFFNSSIASTEELSQFLMFFITFLGTSYAARSGMHIRMSMLADALKGSPRKILAIVVSLGTAIIMFYVAYLSYRYVMKVASLNRVSPILQWPVQYIWIIMPIGMFLTGIQYTLAFVRNIISPGAWISYSVPLEEEPTAMSDLDEQVIKAEDPDPLDPALKHQGEDQERED
ncbi:hypothetical protein C4J81_11695 [Deltaproteobacteria bacterium Smac51]|nr:hypothetical protein C4J81_11695 [Deltaproteobacteria bacterium Smac51]